MTPRARGLWLALWLLGAAASAQEPSLPPELRRQAARAEFERGQRSFVEGDFARALEAFQASRALFANKNNTLNAALCLARLDRPAEALALHDELRRRFASSLTAEDTRDIERETRRLVALVGSLLVQGVAGSGVLIDGVERGRLPLDGPLWLAPGAHSVRVLRQGFVPFEARVEARPGEAAQLAAKQEPLTSSGALRVEVDGDAEVLVDGASVGPAPWEGLLAPGAHLILARGSGGVSAPFSAAVLAGQTTLFRARLLPAGAPVRLRVEPASAALSLDGVALGAGGWEGTLPAGSHILRASEPGYRPVERSFDVEAAGSAPERPPSSLTLALEVDPQHPRWPRPASGKVLLSLGAAGALGASLSSGAEGQCPGGCLSRRLPAGGVVALRVGYESRGGWIVEAQGALALLGAGVRRVVREELNYRVDEELRWRAWWVGPSVGRRLPLGAGWSLVARLGLGVGQADVRSALSVRARSSVDEAAAQVEGGALPASGLVVAAWPSLEASTAIGPWSAGASLGAVFSPLAGPTFDRRGSLVVAGACTPERPAAAACAPDSGALRGERASGPFSALTLGATVGRGF